MDKDFDLNLKDIGIILGIIFGMGYLIVASIFQKNLSFWINLIMALCIGGVISLTIIMIYTAIGAYIEHVDPDMPRRLYETKYYEQIFDIKGTENKYIKETDKLLPAFKYFFMTEEHPGELPVIIPITNKFSVQEDSEIGVPYIEVGEYIPENALYTFFGDIDSTYEAIIHMPKVE